MDKNDTRGIPPQPMAYSGSLNQKLGPDDAVSYEARDLIALITINRPPFNRFDAEVTNALHDAWLRFAQSDERVAVVSATGGQAFCSGGDSWERALDIWWGFPNVGVALDKPVVAAVAGAVIGGGLGFIIFCDLVVAADNAMFSYPEAKAAIAGGVAASLVSRIPAKIAAELLLLGDPIDARRAYEAGLINKVVPLGQELEAAMAYARTLVANGPRCVQMLKRFMDETLAKSPAEQGAIARRQVNDVVFSNDRVEFFASLAEARSPKFTGT